MFLQTQDPRFKFPVAFLGYFRLTNLQLTTKSLSIQHNLQVTDTSLPTNFVESLFSYGSLTCIPNEVIYLWHLPTHLFFHFLNDFLEGYTPVPKMMQMHVEIAIDHIYR